MPVKYRKRKEPRWKGDKSRLHRRSVDWGWVFSRRLVTNYAKAMGISLEEADHIVERLAREVRALMLFGYPVGLPRCPVLYTRRQKRNFSKVDAKTDRERKFPHTYIHTPRPFREECDRIIVDRGSLRDQYEDERLRITGDPRTRVKTRKQENAEKIKRARQMHADNE